VPFGSLGTGRQNAAKLKPAPFCPPGCAAEEGADVLALPPLCARSFDQISSTRLACLEARAAATASAAFELPPAVASRTCDVAER